MLLHLLHYPAQVRSGASLEAELRGQSVGSLEARLAGELIDAYRRPPRWRDYVDDSAQALRALVQATLQGQKPAEPDLQPTPPPALLDALRQSVAALPARRRPPTACGRWPSRPVTPEVFVMETLAPMLAVAAREPFDAADYLFEVKWDGIRALSCATRAAGGCGAATEPTTPRVIPSWPCWRPCPCCVSGWTSTRSGPGWGTCHWRRPTCMRKLIWR